MSVVQSNGRPVVSLSDGEVANEIQTATGSDLAILQNELVSRFRSTSLILAQVTGAQQVTLQAQKIKFEKPPLFTGKLAELPNWIFVVKQYLEINRVTVPEEQAKFAVKRLGDHALTWWRRQATMTGWELGSLEFNKLIQGQEDAFQDVDRLLRLRRKLITIRQTGSAAGSVGALQKIILDMGNQDPDESAQIYFFTEGLKDKVKIKVLLHRPQTLADAEQLAERADSAFYTSLSGPTSQPKKNPRDTGQGPMELGGMEGGQSSNFRPNQRSQCLCFNCGKLGLIDKYCQANKKNNKDQDPSNLGNVDKGPNLPPPPNTPPKDF